MQGLQGSLIPETLREMEMSQQEVAEDRPEKEISSQTSGKSHFWSLASSLFHSCCCRDSRVFFSPGLRSTSETRHQDVAVEHRSVLQPSLFSLPRRELAEKSQPSDVQGDCEKVTRQMDDGLTVSHCIECVSIFRCLDLLSKSESVTTVDITGGAPGNECCWLAAACCVATLNKRMRNWESNGSFPSLQNYVPNFAF